MTKRKRTATSKKRQRILVTATELFTRFGTKRVTVEEICCESNVSKMTFYKYFSNKTQLVQTIHDDLIEMAFAKFDEINALDIPFAEKIDLMGKWKAEFMGRVNAAFFRELIDVEHSMIEFKKRYLRNISRAQKAGEIRQDLDVEFIWLVMEKLGELFSEDKWKDVCGDLGALQSQLRTFVWKGLLTRADSETSRGEESGK